MVVTQETGTSQNDGDMLEERIRYRICKGVDVCLGRKKKLKGRFKVFWYFFFLEIGVSLYSSSWPQLTFLYTILILNSQRSTYLYLFGLELKACITMPDLF